MRIDFIKKCKTDCDLSRKEAKLIIEKIFNGLKKNTENMSCEVILVKDTEMKKINKKFRQINEVTDVLSFPQTTVKNSPEICLGSIIICPSVAINTGQNCKELLAHGILHLLGYDHEKDNINWQKYENKIKDFYELQKI